jgi:hypothetical protein
VFTWAEIILLVLRIVDAVMGRVNQDQWIKAGADAEIAKISAAILRKTAAGKAIMEKIDAMSDADVDRELTGLEPK